MSNWNYCYHINLSVWNIRYSFNNQSSSRIVVKQICKFYMKMEVFDTVEWSHPLRSVAFTRDDSDRNLAAVCFASDDVSTRNVLHLYSVNITGFKQVNIYCKPLEQAICSKRFIYQIHNIYNIVYKIQLLRI